jgi:hypothetical protein
MFLKKSSLTFYLLMVVCLKTFSQGNESLTFTTELPVNLFSAKTAILLSTEESLPPEMIDAIKATYGSYTARLRKDLEEAGLQIVIAGTDSSASEDLASIFQQHKVKNLLVLNFIPDREGQIETYLLLLTSFNGQQSLMNAGQKAFSLQTRSYENLLFLLKDQIYEQEAAKRLQGRQKRADFNPIALPKGQLPEITLLLRQGQYGKGGDQQNFYFTSGGSQGKNAGFWGQRLRKEMEISPEAITHLKKYSTAKTSFLVNRLIFCGTIIAYGLELSKSDTYFNTYQKALSCLAISSSGIRILMNKHTNNHMHRAVDGYNRYARQRNTSPVDNVRK